MINYLIKKIDFNLKSLHDLIITDNKYINNVLSYHYFKIHYNIIKKTQNNKLFLKSLELFEYDKLYNLNNKNENLLGLIIKEKKVKIFLNTWIYYFNQNNIKNEINDYELFLNLFKVIKDDNSLFEILMSYVFLKSNTDKNIEEINLINIKKEIMFRHKNNYLKLEIFNKYINKNNINNLSEFEIKNFSFKIPNFISKNKKLFEIINEATNEIKISEMKFIINYFFNKIFLFKYFNLLMFLITIISLIITLNLNDNISIIIYLISIIYFIFYEFLQLILNYRIYYTNLLNYFDILLLIYNLIIFVFIFTNRIKGINLGILFWFYLNWFKLLSFLKSIELIRKQIRLISKVLISTITFIIFIFVILFYFASINFLFNFSKIGEFKFSIFNIYGMMLGTFDDNYSEFQIENFIELFINTYIFNIILLNLFISVIGDIFNHYNENKELYDIEEKILILIEYSSVYSFLENIKKIFKYIINKISPNKFKFKLLESYLFIIIKNKKNENDINQKIDDLKDDINEKINNMKFEMKNEIQKINDKIDYQFKNEFKNGIEKINNNIDFKIHKEFESFKETLRNKKNN